VLFRLKVVLVTEKSLAAKMAPPSSRAVLPVKVLCEMVTCGAILPT
jgi:hypothetical protein